jgi:type I restriction enzyme R subunit
VQCLSRLNRSAPELGKLSEDLFILDFYNTTKGIKESFDPFYTATTLSDATDVNILHQLKTTLLTIGVFDMEEVNSFIELFVHGAPADQFAPIIDCAADRFNNEIDWPDNGKADFKMKCKQFVKVYSRVAAIMDYEVPDWEKLFWFLRLLIPQLIITGNNVEVIKDLLDSVDLNTYGLRRTALNETITLDAGESTIDPLKPTMVNAGPTDDPVLDPLDKIIREFNETWFKGWESTPEDQKTKLVSITKAVAADDDYQNLVIGNPDQQAVEAAMATIIDRVIRQKRKGDMSLYREYQQNDAFKAGFRSLIVRMLDNLEYL